MTSRCSQKSNPNRLFFFFLQFSFVPLGMKMRASYFSFFCFLFFPRFTYLEAIKKTWELLVHYADNWQMYGQSFLLDQLPWLSKMFTRFFPIEYAKCSWSKLQLNVVDRSILLSFLFIECEKMAHAILVLYFREEEEKKTRGSTLTLITIITDWSLDIIFDRNFKLFVLLHFIMKSSATSPNLQQGKYFLLLCRFQTLIDGICSSQWYGRN